MTSKRMVVGICLLVGFVTDAETVAIGGLGSARYPDGEISTNIVINTRRNDTKQLTLRLESRSTGTSALQIAFGRDANGNGELEPEETALVIGRRQHEYFVEDVAGGNRYTESGSATDAANCYLAFDLLTDVDFRPQSVTISSESGRLFAALGVQAWMYDQEWNLAKLTRRGTGSIGELCSVDNKYRAMMMLFR